MSLDREIYGALKESDAILRRSDLFTDSSNPLAASLVARVIILLAQCLKRSAEINNEPCELQAVGIDPKSNDGRLATLLDRGRNLNAHPFSGLRDASGVYIDMFTAWGRAEGFLRLGDEESVSFGVDDDITFIWGRVQIALIGDILAAHNWLRERYAPDLGELSATISKELEKRPHPGRAASWNAQGQLLLRGGGVYFVRDRITWFRWENGPVDAAEFAQEVYIEAQETGLKDDYGYPTIQVTKYELIQS